MVCQSTTMASMKKKTPTVNVKTAKQQYCNHCGVICEGIYGCKNSTISLARTTNGEQIYYCSMVCGKASVLEDNIKICKELEEHVAYNYIVSKKQIAISLAEDPKACKKEAFILCKSFKIQAVIFNQLQKHNWFNAGLLYREHKDLFTEAGEVLLSDEKKYMCYLNRLKALHDLGLSITNVLNVDNEGERTNNASDLWE